MTETNTSNLQMFESAPQIDFEKYEGKRAKIEIVQVVDAVSDYGLDGIRVVGLKRPVKKLHVATEVLETIQKDEPIQIRAHAYFNLKEKVVNGTTVWGVSKSTKSKLYNFMKKQKANTVDELKGTLVTLTTKTDDNDRVWLNFAQ